MDVFAAGAVVRRGRDFVLTLNTDDVRPDDGDAASPRVRVGWVGGGLEPGETPLECLAREAEEELDAELEVVPVPVPRLWDWAGRRFEDVDAPPAGGPLLLVRARDGRHAVVYLAAVDTAAELRPGGDDVVGLVVLPPRLWPLVEAGAMVEDAAAAGAQLIGAETLPAGTLLWLHPQAFLRIAVPLVLS